MRQIIGREIMVHNIDCQPYLIAKGLEGTVMVCLFCGAPVSGKSCKCGAEFGSIGVLSSFFFSLFGFTRVAQLQVLNSGQVLRKFLFVYEKPFWVNLFHRLLFRPVVVKRQLTLVEEKLLYDDDTKSSGV